MSDEFTKFNGTIGPANLLSLVRNTAPFLFTPDFIALVDATPQTSFIAMGAHPYGWLKILLNAEKLDATDNPNSAQRADYFALCLACHHATVATFIPTDVDSKIRGVLWQQREDPEIRRAMFDFTLHALKWDISRISTRATELSGVGPVSGHNGEMLGVLAGALGCFAKHGDTEFAERAAEAIDAELKREAHEFSHVLELRGREIDLLRLSSSLTHNCGDLDQGISFWNNNPVYAPYRERFHKLAHENTQPYDGTFQVSAKLYKNIMSSEGHRHYPLREIRAIRQSRDFLLPLGPFFDDWGANIALNPKLKVEERAEVLAALLSGCKKIAGQAGYYRAISGFVNSTSNLDAIVKRMPAALRHQLNDAEIKRHIMLKKVSFESGMRKRALAVLGRAV